MGMSHLRFFEYHFLTRYRWGSQKLAGPFFPVCGLVHFNPQITGAFYPQTDIWLGVQMFGLYPLRACTLGEQVLYL